MKRKKFVLIICFVFNCLVLQGAKAIDFGFKDGLNTIIGFLNLCANSAKSYFGSQGMDDITLSKQLQVDNCIAKIPVDAYRNMPYEEYCYYKGNSTRSFDINERCRIIFGDQINKGEIIGQSSNVTIFNTNNYRKNTYTVLPYKHNTGGDL